MHREQFLAYFGEQIGYKSGLALSFDELISHIDATSTLFTQLTDPMAVDVSMHFNDLLDSFQLVLHRLGVLPDKYAYHAPTYFRAKFRGDANYELLVEGILNLLAGPMDWALPKPGRELMSFLDKAEKSWGKLGRTLAGEIVDMMYLHRIGALCEIDRFRVKEWSDSLELKGLFSSESLDSAYGQFIDQRYIDYLEANFTSIDRINWRKFEGLTGEYFSRSGYSVVMGAGRGDGGVDIRVWKAGLDNDCLPPTILIQCKRQKTSVEQVIVKSLWADVINEKAESGLIVTSTRVAPGAKKVCSARAYPIGFVERPSLARWLKALRTPGSGILTNS